MFDIVCPLPAVLFDLPETAGIVPQRWFKVSQSTVQTLFFTRKSSSILKELSFKGFSPF
jgi:hypothetical protein